MPTSLLRACALVMGEAQVGLKAHLRATLRGLPVGRLAGGCAERRRLYLLAAWFHGVVCERLRYAPLAGFSNGHYEIGPVDAQCALAVVDHQLELGGKGVGQRRHVDIDTEIPWAALRAVLAEST